MTKKRKVKKVVRRASVKKVVKKTKRVKKRA